MNSMSFQAASPVGVCVLPEPPPNAARTVSHAAYIHEILSHAGLCYGTVALEEITERLPALRVLVTVGGAPLPEETRSAVRAWVRAGGAWLAIGGTGGLPDLLGVEEERPAMLGFGGDGRVTLGEGYLRVDHPLHPVLAHLKIPLHFYNGLAVHRADGQAIAGVLDVHQRSTRRAAIVEAAPGAGHCLFIAPDLTGAVVRIQQGIAVTRDAPPAPDGTAPVSDGVLKSDDGAVLDWHFDRQSVHPGPGFPAFLQPVADQWRELLLRSILYLATERRAHVPLLWSYPRDLPALGVLSHDTDGNEPQKARKLLSVLNDVGVRSTWCVQAPGYGSDVIREIRAAGHETAMHFDAMSDGTAFTEAEFDAQYQALCRLLGEPPVTNKNHYLRWEGDTAFFEWCALRGIRVDQSKGASKTGEAGFNFGACHPYRPARPDGSIIDILEMPTPTQDLGVFATPDLLHPLLEAVERQHGILHLLFHPAHIETEGVETALRHAVETARARGLEWWTARELDAWERGRRSVTWSGYCAGEGTARVRMDFGAEMPGATVLWLAPAHAQVQVDGEPVETQAVERFGARFVAATFDAAPGAHTLEVTAG